MQSIAPTPAPPPGGAHCNFFIVTQRRTWQDAETDCASRHEGGHLASVTSQAEQDFVHGLSSSALWIGLNDVLAEALCDGDGFVWAGGAGTVNGRFAHWATGEPDDNNGCDPDDMADNDEDCVLLTKRSGEWGGRPAHHFLASLAFCPWHAHTDAYS